MSPNRKIRILVAEDHVIARVGVTAIVNMQPDMTVVAEATNGQQAIELYRRHLPDITLLDLRMPIVSGIEAAVKIRQEFPEAKMIALSEREKKGNHPRRNQLNVPVPFVRGGYPDDDRHAGDHREIQQPRRHERRNEARRRVRKPVRCRHDGAKRGGDHKDPQ